MAVFARALAMSPQALQNYLQGKMLPGNAVQEKLRALGCDIEWLMTGKKSGYAQEQYKKQTVAEPLIEFNAPGGVPPEVKKKMQKLARALSELNGEEVDKIQSVIDLYLEGKKKRSGRKR